jgi:hypothetical protein
MISLTLKYIELKVYKEQGLLLDYTKIILLANMWSILYYGVTSSAAWGERFCSSFVFVQSSILRPTDSGTEKSCNKYLLNKSRQKKA